MNQLGQRPGFLQRRQILPLQILDRGDPQRVVLGEVVAHFHRLSGTEIPQRAANDLAPPRNADRQAFRSEAICGAAQALDRRAYPRLAQPLPKARQGLGEPQSQSARILAPRLNPPHAPKTLQSRLIFPDRL